MALHSRHSQSALTVGTHSRHSQSSGTVIRNSWQPVTVEPCPAPCPAGRSQVPFLFDAVYKKRGFRGVWTRLATTVHVSRQCSALNGFPAPGWAQIRAPGFRSGFPVKEIDCRFQLKEIDCRFQLKEIDCRFPVKEIDSPAKAYSLLKGIPEA